MPEGKFVTYRFLNMRVQPLTKEDLLGAIESTVESDASNSIIGNQNMHSLYLLHRDAEMRLFFDDCRYTHIDGMWIVLLARALRVPLYFRHRTAYLDWFADFLRMAERKSWRIYLLGGRPEVADKVPTRLHVRYPGLQIRNHHGFDAFKPTTSVYEEIAAFAPHVVLVGMGMPLQEKWILGARKIIRANLFLPIGGTMDFLMDAQKIPPRWLGRLGIEWLYRFLCRPRTMFGRYVLEPLALLPTILRAIVAGKGYVEEQ